MEIKKLIRLRNILIVAVIFLVIIIFFFALDIANNHKINWGTKIAGISIGGETPEEAQDKLTKASEEFLKKEILLNYENQNWRTNPEGLGIEINIEDTIISIFEKGHEGNKFIYNAYWQILSLLGYNFEPIWQINEEKLENLFKESLSSIHQPAKNSILVYENKKQDFTITESSEGIVVDKVRFKKDLAKNINNFENKNIQLNLIKDYPEVVESETDAAYQKAKSILSVLPLKIVMPEDKEMKEIAKIEKEDLLSLIEFYPVLDPKNQNNKILGMRVNQLKSKDYLITLAPLVNREPIDAQLTIKDDKVAVFALSQDGLSLEVDGNLSVISDGILNPSTDGKIKLKIDTVQPKITTESINNLGITAFIATGVSDFSGSPKSRMHNIKIGAAKFNGVLIKPNEEFSFNTTLGEVGPEQGYEPELVIKKDKTIPEYGGGLCQVSTTLFRAAVNAGFKIIERYPHAFPVKYYNPQGFDATIYPPSPDLRFINNTPAHILIQSKIVGYELFFELFGTNDGRKITIDGPYQYEIKEDGSMKARITQKVYDKDNNIIIDKTFYSNYKSPALYPVERNPLE
jgi:vancomycin resistance protein YoaR